MSRPRGHLVVAALLTLQIVALGAALAACGGHSAAAATAPAPVVHAVATTAAPTPVPVARVAPLRARIAPDALVADAASLTSAQVRGLEAATDASSALLVDAGRVHLGPGTTLALGVDPSTFRAWTPAGTAESTPLWQSVAGGRLAVAHAVVAAALGVPLGGPETVGATHAVTRTVGAYATTGLPGVGLVVDAGDSAALGLTRDAALLLTAGGRDPVVTAALAQRYLVQEHLAGTATSTRIPTSNGRLQWVAPAYGPITSPFGPRDDPNDPGHVEVHEGIDIGAPLGSPIYAAAAGVVQYAGPAEGFGQEIILSTPAV